MKKIIISLLGIFISIHTYPQQYEIGLRSGPHYDICTFSGDNDMFYQMLDGLKPSLEIYFNYQTKSNVFFETGIGYRNFTVNPAVYLGMTTSYTAYSIIYLPFRIGYSFNISRQFTINLNMGMDFAYHIDYTTGSIGFNVTGQDSINYACSMKSKDNLVRDFNLYLSNGIELKYHTKSGFTPGLFCTYHAGLLKSWETSEGYIELTDKLTGEKEVYYPTITSRGSSLVFGLSMAWAFGK